MSMGGLVTSAYQGASMGVDESNLARTCWCHDASASCQGVRWYLGSGDASMRGGGQMIVSDHAMACRNQCAYMLLMSMGGLDSFSDALMCVS